MKVDGPSEECSSKQDNLINNVDQEKEYRMCSPAVVIKTSNSNPFASDHNRLGKVFLKPSQLFVNSSPQASSKPVLKQSSFNPFSKPTEENKSDNSDKNQTNGEVKFVPLIKTDSQKSTACESNPISSSTIASSLPTPSFVFGQNLHDRVIGSETVSDPTPSTSLHSNGTGSNTSDMLFSTAIKNEVKADTSKDKEVKSLTESAREYEESRANKRKYDEVEVKTGEEDETNILSVSCKLFSFDKATSNWQERGRGTLRLNDFEMDDGQIGSRIVFRTAGSLRVILNTKIWAEMTVDKANEKSIRLTALDSNGEIKVFLIMSSIEDSRQLYSRLQLRLEKEIAIQKRKKIEPDSSGQ